MTKASATPLPIPTDLGGTIKLNDDTVYYPPWKWHWRESNGQAWTETGDQQHKTKVAEAAYGKLIIRVWNNDQLTDSTSTVNAFVEISGRDKAGKKVGINVAPIFSQLKYTDSTTTVRSFNIPSYVPTTPPAPPAPPTNFSLRDVGGGTSSYADSGDQEMQSWDAAEFYFTHSPSAIRFLVSMWLSFDFHPVTNNKVFYLDPEMEVVKLATLGTFGISE